MFESSNFGSGMFGQQISSLSYWSQRWWIALPLFDRLLSFFPHFTEILWYHFFSNMKINFFLNEVLTMKAEKWVWKLFPPSEGHTLAVWYPGSNPGLRMFFKAFASVNQLTIIYFQNYNSEFKSVLAPEYARTCQQMLVQIYFINTNETPTDNPSNTLCIPSVMIFCLIVF